VLEGERRTMTLTIGTGINGGPDDTIDVREGNTGLNNRDLVDCGGGQHARVIFDEGEDGDKVVRGEIKTPR